MQAYHLQDLGYDTLDANLALGYRPMRTYEMAASMLQELGVRRVRLMTNNPLKRKGLSEHGIHVEDRIQHLAGLGKHNIRYLETKAERGRGTCCPHRRSEQMGEPILTAEPHEKEEDGVDQRHDWSTCPGLSWRDDGSVFDSTSLNGTWR